MAQNTPINKEGGDQQPPFLSPHKDNPLLGMTAGIAAFFLMAVMNVFAKILSETHHVAEIAFYRNLIATLPFLFLIYAMGRKEILVIKSNVKGIVARSVIGTLSLMVTFAAFAAMPMADVTAFLFTASLIVPALGYFFLKERVGPYRWAAIGIGFIGVLVMLQPAGNFNSLGVTLALSAAAMHAALQTILRGLGKTESPQTVTFYFVFIGTFVALIPLPLVFTMPTWSEAPLILACGLSGMAAQFLLSVAYKNAPAAIVTVFNYSGIIWATLFGWFIWNDWPTMPIWIGGLIVIVSNLFILWRETRLARRPIGARARAQL
jgi:drug/metabolite transporter (DMT)-like permease